jgi:hypothetical protein
MPYSPKAHRFFELCAKNPGKARAKCPPKATAVKLASHGVKKSSNVKRR